MQGTPQEPTLSADHELEDGERVSDDGTVDLAWKAGGGADGFELQQSPDAGFDDAWTRYRGADTETVVTGLREGTYHFRVRAVSGEEAGPWSEPLTLTVRYLGRPKLYLLLATGATVAGLTIATIIAGFLKNR